jgi:hypothetical protein
MPGIGEITLRALGRAAVGTAIRLAALHHAAVVAVDLEAVGLEGVSLAAAAHRRIVGLHQRLEPFAAIDRRFVPLPDIASRHLRGRPQERRQDQQSKDDAEDRQYIAYNIMNSSGDNIS